jgi:hypothetical protein
MGAEQGEIVDTDKHPSQLFGRIDSCEIDAFHGVICCDLIENLPPFPIKIELQHRCRVRILTLRPTRREQHQLHDAIRIREVQRFQQDYVDDAEDSGIRADAQSQC